MSLILASSSAVLIIEGQTGSDGSPSVGERAAAESDTVEMASTSDGSGNREW